MTHFLSGRLRPVFFAVLLGITTAISPIAVQAETRSAQQQIDSEKTSDYITLELSEQSITVEVANNERTRSKGLMYRAAMPADAGMLFVFDYPHQHSYWMQCTYLPL